jgi:D-alanyl-D-alanine carboxypeptidase
VVVGFGFDTSSSRDAKVREQVKKYLSKGRSGGYLQTAVIGVPGRKGATVQVATADPTPVVPMPYPSFRLGQQRQPAVAEQEVVAVAERKLPDPEAVAAQLAQPVLVATVDPNAPRPVERPADLGIEPAVQAATMMAGAPVDDRPLDVIGAWLSDTFSLGAAPSPLGQTRPSAPLLPPVGIGEEGQPIDPMISGTVGAQPTLVAEQQAPAPIAVAPQAAPVSGWAVQIGAPPTEEGAASLLSSAAGSVSSLGAFQPYIERFEKNGQVFFRARFVGFDGREDATAMCGELKKAKVSCLAMQS